MKNNRRKTEVTLDETILYDKVTQLQTNILGKLKQLRGCKKNYQCCHFERQTNDKVQYNRNCNYYQKFWKLYLLSELKRSRVEKYTKEIKEFEQSIQNIQEMFHKLEEIRMIGNFPKKKIRRKACDVNKQFLCQQEGCYKSYGTQLALRLHIRQKHHQFSTEPTINHL